MRPVVAKPARDVQAFDRVLMGDPGRVAEWMFIAEVDTSWTSVVRWAVDGLERPAVVREGVTVMVLEGNE